MCDQPEVKYTAGTPADVGGIRNRLIRYYTDNMGKGAAEWKGGFQAPLNPMQQGAMNTVYNKMGYSQGGFPSQSAPPATNRTDRGQQTSFQGSPQEQILRYLMMAQQGKDQVMPQGNFR